MKMIWRFPTSIYLLLAGLSRSPGILQVFGRPHMRAVRDAATALTIVKLKKKKIVTTKISFFFMATPLGG